MEIRIRCPGSNSVDTKNFTDYTTRYFTVELQEMQQDLACRADLVAFGKVLDDQGRFCGLLKPRVFDNNARRAVQSRRFNPNNILYTEAHEPENLDQLYY